MESITDFIYTGSISPTRNNVLQLLRTAIHFDITGKHFSLKIPVLGFLLLYDKIHKSPTTHQEPVVWKLTKVQAAGPRCVCGQRTIYSYFKCQRLSAESYVFLHKVRTFRTSL